MPGCQEPGAAGDLSDTVKPYGRHALVLTGTTNWGPRLGQRDDLLGRMAADVKAMGDDVDPKPKLTALATAPAGDAFDVIVYPEAVVYRGVDAHAWEALRDGHLTTGEPVDGLGPQPIGGGDVLVCVNGARDERCGHCGPLVFKAIGDALADRGRTDVRVHMSSHVGGHRFAGNVLMYPGGTWYGYVTPEHVGDLLDAHFGPQGVWESHYRGRMVAQE